jgi:shikimate 5-dehydrogenase
VITGATRVAGVIGTPIRHSLSPSIFNAAFVAAGLDWAYLAFDVPEGAAGLALGGMRALEPQLQGAHGERDGEHLSRLARRLWRRCGHGPDSEMD